MDRDQPKTPQTPSQSDAKRKQAERGVGLISNAVNAECQRNAAATNNMIFVKNSLSTCIFEAIPVDLLKGTVNMLSESSWNAPDFWLPRSVPIIRLGIMGHTTSKRNELLRSFLGSAYITLEEQLGCRTKLAMRIGDRDYLILIREESGSPAEDFILWADTLVITANSGRTTSIAESYVKYFNQIRSIREVHVVLASIKDTRSQSMEFVPRFTCVCVDAPHVEVNIETKANIYCAFKLACEGFISRSWRPQTPFTFRTPMPLSRRHSPRYSRQTPGFDSTVELPTATKAPQSHPSDRGNRSVRFATSVPITTAQGNEAEKVMKPHGLPSWTQAKTPDASPYLEQALKPRTRADGAVASVTKERSRPYPRKIVNPEEVGSKKLPRSTKPMEKKQPCLKPVPKRGCVPTPQPPKGLDATIFIESDED